MPVEELTKEISEDIKAASNVNAVFGESRTVGAKTIVPVAMVRMGVGASAGSKKPGVEGHAEEGGGSGGGGAARPVAILEVSEQETKLIPVIDMTRIILSGIFMAGVMTWLITGIFRGKKD